MQTSCNKFGRLMMKTVWNVDWWVGNDYYNKRSWIANLPQFWRRAFVVTLPVSGPLWVICFAAAMVTFFLAILVACIGYLVERIWQ